MFPVFFYDLVRTARRGRHTFIRFLYAGALTFLLLHMYAAWMAPHILPSIGSEGFFHGIWNTSAVPGRVLADFASTYFYVFAAVQFLVVVLLTPPYVAGAIAEERERDTLQALFVTHLRNHQIVLSLLFSRLIKLAAILLAGIPILSFLQLLGGIDPTLVYAVFAATGMMALSITSLGLLLSIYAGRARRAIVQTEAIVMGYLVVTTFFEIGSRNPLIVRPGSLLLQPFIGEYTLIDILGWLGLGNPGVGSFRIHDSLRSRPFGQLLREYLTDYVLFHGVIAVVCIVWSILRLRAVALRDQQSAQEQGTRQRRLSSLARRWRWEQLDSPLLWKGLVVDARSRQGLFTWIYRGCGVALVFWPLLHIIYCFGRFQGVSDHDYLVWLVNDWCRIVSAFLGSAMLLAVGLRASTSISGERARQTLDSLLVSPLPNRTIIVHKWLSSIFAPRGWGLTLAIVWAAGLTTGAVHAAAVPCFLICWLIQAAFVAAIGVWFSAVSPSTRRSVLATVGLAVTVMVVLGVIAAYWFWKGHNPGELLTLEPPVTLGVVAFSSADYQECLSEGFQSWLRIISLEQALGAVAAGVFLVLAYLDFRKVTGRREGSVSDADQPTTSEKAVDSGVEEYMTSSRANWSVRLLRGVLLFLPIGLLAGWYVIRSAAGDDKLSDMLVYLDRTDPGWRLEDIAAARPQVADEENSAKWLIEAMRLMPPEATNAMWSDPFSGHSAELQLSENQKAQLQKDMLKIQPFLPFVRKVADMPNGSFPIRFSSDGIGTDLSHCNDVRRLWWALILDAVDQSEAGDADGALRSCRAAVNASRAVADEPAVMSQLVRTATGIQTMFCLERILAQGQPSAGAMEEFQQLLEHDERGQSFGTALRGERAAFDRYIQAMRRGDSTQNALQSRPGQKASQWSDDVIVPILGGSLKSQRAALLEYYTQAVEAARLPTEQQIARFGAIPMPSAFDQPLVLYLLISLNRIANNHLNALAQVRCGIVALALERYRRKTGHWPEKLAELVPENCAKIPVDPFTGKPMLYRRLADGVVVYSVGADGVDDGGKLDRKNLVPNGAFDVGIRLWNVDKRRQPYREQ